MVSKLFGGSTTKSATKSTSTSPFQNLPPFAQKTLMEALQRPPQKHTPYGV